MKRTLSANVVKKIELRGVEKQYQRAKGKYF